VARQTPDPIGAPAIRAAGLTKDHGRERGLFALDLDVRRGEALGFLGPNGRARAP